MYGEQMVSEGICEQNPGERALKIDTAGKTYVVQQRDNSRGEQAVVNVKQ